MNPANEVSVSEFVSGIDSAAQAQFEEAMPRRRRQRGGARPLQPHFFLSTS